MRDRRACALAALGGSYEVALQAAESHLLRLEIWKDERPELPTKQPTMPISKRLFRSLSSFCARRSGLGRSRRFGSLCRMSAVPLIADIGADMDWCREGPTTDIGLSTALAGGGWDFFR